MAHVMMTLQRPGGRPTLEQVKEELGLTSEQIDPVFGVVEIDPRDNTYAVRVEEAAATTLPDAARTTDEQAQKTQAKSGEPATPKGPYSDPKIEPMGLGSQK